ncbi:MAG: DUF2116 family Zn-ribbon domain-containing protein [Candidatus Pacebacteria bacterium]|nr:DUF2116 family Zn-ribbon domain-containing protein [Candidatus Paceibacterota bacterium]
MNITPHHHCIVCAEAIPSDKRFCSQRCEDRFVSVHKKKNFFNMLLMTTVLVWLVILVFLTS